MPESTRKGKMALTREQMLVEKQKQEEEINIRREEMVRQETAKRV